MGMTDREKVLKGLECLITDEVSCEGCPYNGSGYCLKNIAKDARELLKAQEPVRPWQVSSMDPWFRCGACQKPIEYEHMFCPFCGKAVKWHD